MLRFFYVNVVFVVVVVVVVIVVVDVMSFVVRWGKRR